MATGDARWAQTLATHLHEGAHSASSYYAA